MSIASLIKSKCELTHTVGQSGPVVISTRMRLARNLRDFPFPGRATPVQKSRILDICEGALYKLPVLQKEKCVTVRMDQLTELERQVLVERHIISRELSSMQAAAAVVSRNQSIAIMINEEDHLRIQVLKSGFQFKKAWKLMDALDTELEQQIDYAFSGELGYLTACPTNLGTAMRASVMMHLPGLVMSEQVEKIIRAVNQLGLAVRGLFGEGTEAHGSLFQISNQQTLGESENTIMQRLSSVLTTVIEQETAARKKLMDTEGTQFMDKIGRAFGLLRNAHCLNSVEAMNLLSLMRLAVDLGLLEEDYRGLVDRLFIENQPGHIQLMSDASVAPDKRDTLRAELLRQEFLRVPDLNFENVSNKKA